MAPTATPTTYPAPHLTQHLAQHPHDTPVTWSEGLAVAVPTMTRMAHRGMVWCGDVWTLLGGGIEGASARLDAITPDGDTLTTPDARSPLAAYPEVAEHHPQGASRCCVANEPFAPVWAVLAARILEGAGVANTVWGDAFDPAAPPDTEPPDTMSAFVDAADRDAVLYGRILAALAAYGDGTAPGGGVAAFTPADPPPGATSPEGATYPPAVGTKGFVASFSRWCTRTAMGVSLEASTETRGGAWRRHVQRPWRFAIVPGMRPIPVPAGAHPLVAVYLVFAAQARVASGLPALRTPAHPHHPGHATGASEP